MRLLSLSFISVLAYAHRHGDSRDQPLSLFRDGDQQIVGAVLFSLLAAIGALLVRKLIRLRGYAGAFVLTIALILLLIVSVTPSYDSLHHLCAFGLLGLVGVYYTAWLNLEKGRWLWPHLILTAVFLFEAVSDSYGFWQKAFILYFVLLVNVHDSFLKGIPPERGVEYVLYPRAKELPPRKTVYRLKREFFDKDRESP